MVMSYFALFPDFLDADKNPYAQATGFFVNPRGPAGRKHLPLRGPLLGRISQGSNLQRNACQGHGDIKGFPDGTGI